jgi:hypothetical protein
VSVTASATGAFVNTTSAIVADQTAPGGTASAALSAGSVFAVNYAANLNAGDSIINIINTGENGAPLNGPGYGAVIGNLCVNVYAFSADEQLIDCCSCLVTPDGLAVLSIDNDLIANPATGVTPTSVVVKLLTTLAGPGGSANTCNNSAAVPGALVSGISAWSTTLHATTAPGAFSVTERSFSAATLSAGELASLTGRCSQIIGNNSGAGVCPSCFSGLFAGGADQQ